MNCTNCGAPLEENTTFCPTCGVAVEQKAAPATEPAAEQSVYGFPEPTAPKPFTERDLPEEYRPLSPWSYFWLQVLFMIPLIGFIFLIIFSCKRSNINRRNFARSHWIGWILVAILGIVVLVLAFVFRLIPAVVL